MDPALKANEVQHPYIGMWVTKDGYIRHELRQTVVMMKHGVGGKALIKAAISFKAITSNMWMILVSRQTAIFGTAFSIMQGCVLDGLEEEQSGGELYV